MNPFPAIARMERNHPRIQNQVSICSVKAVHSLPQVKHDVKTLWSSAGLTSLASNCRINPYTQRNILNAHSAVGNFNCFLTFPN